MMIAHVDQFGSLLYALECRFGHGLRFTHESDYCAVGRFTWIDVQKFDVLYRSNGCGDGIDHRAVASLAEVGHALNEPGLHGIVIMFF